MPSTCRGVHAARIMACLCAAALAAAPAVGQITSLHAPRTATAGSPANVFAEWLGEAAVDGFDVEVPAGCRVDSITILRHGYREIPARVRQVDALRYRVMAERPIAGPHDLVVHVRPGDVASNGRVQVTPLEHAGTDLFARVDMRAEELLRASLPSARPDNHALSFSGEAAEPLVLRRARTPDLSLRHPFTLSFWMRSAALGEVVLSTWNGDEHRTYPLEIVVDRSGRLRAFRGRPGEHQSLVGRRPVADGAWHQVTVTNRPADGWMHLAIDGATVDSLFTLPAPRIDMRFPVVLGGRYEHAAAYFDGLRPYSGRMDDVRIASQGSEPLLLGFERHVDQPLLERPARGLRRIPADLGGFEPLDAFRAVVGEEGVEVSWSAPDAAASAYVVERSYDGHAFEEVDRVPASPDGFYRVVDRRVHDRVVYYRIRRIYLDGSEHVTGIIRVGLGAPEPDDVVLLGNFPNPFNPSTTIKYEVRRASPVHVAVWDLSGQPVSVLVDQMQQPGVYEARFDAYEQPSGTYFVRLRTPDGVASHKMILTK